MDISQRRRQQKEDDKSANDAVSVMTPLKKRNNEEESRFLEEECEQAIRQRFTDDEDPWSDEKMLKQSMLTNDDGLAEEHEHPSYKRRCLGLDYYNVQSRFGDDVQDQDRAEKGGTLNLLQLSRDTHVLQNQTQPPNYVSYKYKCDVCGRGFSTFQGLGDHKSAGNKCHRVKVKPPKTMPLFGKVHKCSICDQRFTTGQALGGHMSIHNPNGVLGNGGKRNHGEVIRAPTSNITSRMPSPDPEGVDDNN